VWHPFCTASKKQSKTKQHKATQNKQPYDYARIASYHSDGLRPTLTTSSKAQDLHQIKVVLLNIYDYEQTNAESNRTIEQRSVSGRAEATEPIEVNPSRVESKRTSDCVIHGDNGDNTFGMAMGGEGGEEMDTRRCRWGATRQPGWAELGGPFKTRRQNLARRGDSPSSYPTPTCEPKTPKRRRPNTHLSDSSLASNSCLFSLISRWTLSSISRNWRVVSLSSGVHHK